MIEFLNNIDSSIMLALNGAGGAFWDQFMYTFSGKWIWVPMYATLLFILFRLFEWRIATVYALAIILTIVICDQLCASHLRPLVGRLRPSNPDNPLSQFIHIVKGYRGGAHGFPSCHAANSFGLATILSFIIARKRFVIFIMSWATLNSYSRICLGVHYPGDILVGAAIGFIVGYLMYRVGRSVARRVAERHMQPSHPVMGHVSFSGMSVSLRVSDVMLGAALITAMVITSIAI